MSWHPHIVVAAVVEQDGRFLMIEERINGEQRVNQPAGHWDPGETIIDAVVREAREESGWEVSASHLLGIYEWQPRGLDYPFVRFAFVCEALRHHPEQALDAGIERALWMTREEVIARQSILRGPAVLQCIDDFQAGRRFPLDVLTHFPGLHL